MIADLVGLAQEAATAAEFEGAVLARLQRSLGFDVAFFSVKGASSAPSVIGFTSADVRRSVSGWQRYERDLVPVKDAALRARGVAVDTRVLGEAGVRRTAYHREIAAPLGGKHSLMAYVPLRGRIVGAVMLGRMGGAFADRDIRLMESVLPGLGVARATYGLPIGSGQLRAAEAPGLLARLGLQRGARRLDAERVGDTLVEVRDRDGFREMVAREDGAELVWTRARVHEPSESGWPYIELFHVAAAQATARRRALFIGCGGAVAVRQFSRLYPGIVIDIVEREPGVIRLARDWYDLDAIPDVTVHVADGATFAQHAPASSWDIVIVDAFDASDAAASLRRPAFFAALRRLVVSGGAVAFNVIGTLAGPGPVQDTLHQLSQLFTRVRVVPVMQADEAFSPDVMRNVVLIASKGER